MNKVKRTLTLEIMIQELLGHREYLQARFNEQDDFNQKTWYKAKIALVESLIKELPLHFN